MKTITSSHASSIARRIRSAVFLVPAVLLTLASCGTTTNRTTESVPRTVEYRGVFVEPSGIVIRPPGTGTVRLTVIEAPEASSFSTDPVSPEAIAALDSVALEIVNADGRSTFRGRLDRATGRLTISGPAWMNATLVDARFDGADGRYFAMRTTSADIRAYGGSWTGSRPSGDEGGVLSFLIDGTSVVGLLRNYDGTSGRLQGTYQPGGVIEMGALDYALDGTTSRYAIFGSYESTLDSGRFGTWTTGPLDF